MNRPLSYAILILALWLHMTVLNYFQVFGAKPDLLLICVIFFALFFGESAGLATGIAAGILKDIFALDFFGINAFILGLTGFLIGAMNTKFAKESRSAHLFVVFLFTIFAMSFHYLLFAAFSKPVGMVFFGYLFSSVLPAAVYTSIIAVPIFTKLIDMYNLREMEDLL